MLRGESVDVIQKEFMMHVLVYNLVRLLMWRAAREHGVNLHRLSFAGTLHRMRAALPLLMLLSARGVDSVAVLSNKLMKLVAEDTVPYRPNRIEPRRKKRRPKQYSLLVKPRQWYRLHGDDHAR